MVRLMVYGDCEIIKVYGFKFVSFEVFVYWYR